VGRCYEETQSASTTRRPPPAPGTTLCWLSNRFGGSVVTIDEPVPIVLAQPPSWWLSRHRAAQPGRAAGVVAFLALFLPPRDVGEPTDTAEEREMCGFAMETQLLELELLVELLELELLDEFDELDDDELELLDDELELEFDELLALLLDALRRELQSATMWTNSSGTAFGSAWSCLSSSR